MPVVPHEVKIAEHANTIDKPDMERLKREYGIKACVAMLYTCGLDGDRWRYREIYIHSKLMIVDDLFLTLGSANLNHHSMAVDSEINISLIDPIQASEIRKNIWKQLTGKLASGGKGNKADLKDAFDKWTKLMRDNKNKILSAIQKKESKKLTGHIIKLEDNRSSVIRLG